MQAGKVVETAVHNLRPHASTGLGCGCVLYPRLVALRGYPIAAEIYSLGIFGILASTPTTPPPPLLSPFPTLPNCLIFPTSHSSSTHHPDPDHIAAIALSFPHYPLLPYSTRNLLQLNQSHHPISLTFSPLLPPSLPPHPYIRFHPSDQE